jgi:5-methylcytosine-specific restriction protein A
VAKTGKTRSRSPTWSNDELILALDIYTQHGLLDDEAPRVVALSELLNSLPIHADRGEQTTFRNPNGVALKLANFAALDPGYPGKGMTRGGKRDKEIFSRYHSAPRELSAVALAIRQGARDLEPPTGDEDEPEMAEVLEGAVLYRLHRRRERNPAIVKKKKAAILKQTGRLACEVCGFDFGRVYGELGRGFAECHHRRPLHESGKTKTSVKDLAIVCANCHRMAHHARPWKTVAALRALVEAARDTD